MMQVVIASKSVFNLLFPEFCLKMGPMKIMIFLVFLSIAPGGAKNLENTLFTRLAASHLKIVCINFFLNSTHIYVTRR
jgi:hypothetical protein